MERIFTQVSLEQYKAFCKNVDGNIYTYVPNMLAERTDFRKINDFDEIIATRFLGAYGDPDSYQVRSDFIHLCN